jgi:hypothetical protein
MSVIQRFDVISNSSERNVRATAAAIATVPVVSGMLFVFFALLRIPFRAEYPINWDAVQLALGTQSFNLHHHQPHPPGYIGFIGLGWLVNQITSDPILSLTILSIIAGALAPAFLYVYARHFMTNGFALLIAVLFGLSPMIWYYSEVALTYSAEVAASVSFLAIAHRSIRSVSARDLIFATLLLSAVGALRQSAMLLLIPLWLFCLWNFDWGSRVRVGAVMILSSLLWVVPLLWLSGGPATYVQESRALADLIGGQTSILSMNFTGLQMNVSFVLAGILIGVNAGLIVIALALVLGVRPLRRLTKQDKIFFSLWLAPALITFILGHAGQLGYVLLLLPVFFLLLGICLEEMATADGTKEWLRSAIVTSSVAVVALVSATGFLVMPGAAYSWMQPGENERDTRTSLHLRQYDIKTSDAHWASLVTLARNYPPDNTVILTTVGGPRVSGSFRHASYLLPEYRVYGLGTDLSGEFGYLFLAHQNRSDYSVNGLEQARPWLPLASGARWIIIPDGEIMAWIDPAIEYRTVTLDGGGSARVAFVPPRTAIEFQRNER